MIPFSSVIIMSPLVHAGFSLLPIQAFFPWLYQNKHRSELHAKRKKRKRRKRSHVLFKTFGRADPVFSVAPE